MARYTELLSEYLETNELPEIFDQIDGFKEEFTSYYIDREIGFETENLFKIKLENYANVLIPLYVIRLKQVTNATTLTIFIKTGSTGLNMSMKAYYIKLEQGTSYTGKYYEDWGTEQIRCQRYYQPVQVLGLSNIPATTTTLLVSAPLITSLRTKPSASLLFGSRMPSVTGNGATITCNGVSVTNISQSACLLTFTLKTEATLLQLYAITTQCNIALDSEFSIGAADLGTSGWSI